MHINLKDVWSASKVSELPAHLKNRNNTTIQLPVTFYFALKIKLRGNYCQLLEGRSQWLYWRTKKN